MEKVLENIKNEFTINGILDKRYYHTIGVIETALELNRIHHLQIDEKKVILAAGYHDIAKFLPKEKMLDILKEKYPEDSEELQKYPSIWHSFVGAIYTKQKYHIDDKEVLDAIRFHTTGRPKMTDLEKIIFISDYIEEKTRAGAYVIQPRNLAKQDLNGAIVAIIKQTIAYLQKNKQDVYHLTKETYLYYQNEVCHV